MPHGSNGGRAWNGWSKMPSMDRCPGTDWSPIANAPTNSQLAGVIAGFVFAGLVMLLSQRDPGKVRMQALSLLLASFIMLALDSYLYSLIAGDTATLDACPRIWTESMYAGGLLGVGGVAMTSAIAWLFAAHFEGFYMSRPDMGSGAEGPGSHFVGFGSVERFARTALYSVATVVSILLSVTGLDYLNVMYDREPPGWLMAAVILYPLGILSMIIILRFRARRGQAYRNRSRNPPEHLGAALHVSVYGAIFYATISMVLVGIAATVPTDKWNAAPSWVPVTTTMISLLLPAPILVALVYAVPRLHQPMSSPRGKRTTLTILRRMVRVSSGLLVLLATLASAQAVDLYK